METFVCSKSTWPWCCRKEAASSSSSPCPSSLKQEVDPPAPWRRPGTPVPALSVLELTGNQCLSLIFSHLTSPNPTSAPFHSVPSFMFYSPFRLQSVRSGPGASMGTAPSLIGADTKARGHIVHQYQPAPVSAHRLHLPSLSQAPLNKTAERKPERPPKSFRGKNTSLIVAVVNYRSWRRGKKDTKEDTARCYLICKCIPF